ILSQDRFVLSRRAVCVATAFSVHLFCAAFMLSAQPTGEKTVRTAIRISQADQGTASVSHLNITLKPGKPDQSGNISFVDVTVRVEKMKADAGQPLLSLPTVVSNVQTVALSIDNLSASDDAGSIPLTVRDDNNIGEKQGRRWLAGRVVNGSITVQYRVPISNLPNPRGAAPPLELRSEDGAFSGAASTFVVLPETESRYAFSLHWDLSALPPGAVGMSSLGVGDLQVDAPQSLDHLQQVLYFFGGTIHRFPAQPASNGFLSAWQGTPPFDGEALMRWTDQLDSSYLDFFRPNHVEPFAVLLRCNPINAGGGVEVGNSFIGTFDDHTEVEPLKLTVAHEMVHTFVRGLDGSQREDGSWFSEGTAVYYERLLPLRVGLITPDEFLRDLNSTAARYYTDALNHTPNSEIAANFWAETRIRVLPYDRGSLYFSMVDSRVRAASGGKRSLDNLILAMIDRRRRGLAMNEAAWRAILTSELGSSGTDEFDAMLRGDLVLPASDAFGPCFRRTEKMLRRYELGFDAKVLIEPTRIVRGLIPGSAAERAGLRNGDRILKPVPQDGIQGDQTALIHLEIFRDGKQFPLSYLPRGEAVKAYQWERVPGIPEAVCALPSTLDPIR
ncbi:MAG: hypothetical protein WBW68_02220, partial [Terracidiphilus sp.]